MRGDSLYELHALYGNGKEDPGIMVKGLSWRGGGSCWEPLPTQRRRALIRVRDVSKPVWIHINMPCELSFPLEGPGSHRGGNPRKMGKNCKIPLPCPTPEMGKIAPKKG